MPGEDGVRLAALVISHNSAEDLPGCLQALSAHACEFSGGILVVDNASSDGSQDVVRGFAGVRLAANPVNCGFAGAVNQGFEALPTADAVLLLNPDAHLESPPSLLAAELEDSRVAAAGGQLVDREGRPQTGFQVRRFPTPAALAFEVMGLNRLWPSNPVNQRWRALDLDPAAPALVEQPAAACLLIRRLAWLELGGFDEGFFPLWFEDVDFLRRACSKGWLIRYNPQFRAAHRGGHSVARISWRDRQLYWYGSLLRYSIRHFGLQGRWLVGWAVIFGSVMRLVMGIITERSSRGLSVYGKVMRLAFLSLWRDTAREDGPRRTTRQVAIEDCGPFGSGKSQEGNRQSAHGF